MSTTRTAQESYDSLTGFDEIAIRQQFRTSISALVDPETGDQMLQARALMFVELRREGMTDHEAHKAAMSAAWSDVRDYFRNDADEQPEQPDEQLAGGAHTAVYRGEPDPLGLGALPTS